MLHGARRRRREIPRAGLVAAWNLTTRNLLKWSEDLTQAAWTKMNGSITSASVTAPNGDASVSKFTASGNDAYLQQAYAGTTGLTYTFSVWLRADAPRTVKVFVFNGADDIGSSVNHGLTTSWQHITVTATLAAGTTFRPAIGGYNSLENGAVIYVWGAQLNAGATPLQYQRTTDQQSVPSRFGNGYPLQLGSTAGVDANDPAITAGGLSFGADDKLTGLPAKGATWTAINANGVQCDAVDSAGAQYRNGAANAAAVEYDVGTVGGYTGVLASLARWSRLLTASQHARIYRVQRRKGVAT